MTLPCVSELTAQIGGLLQHEEKIQYRELHDKKQSIIYDMTPIQGDLFAMVSRSVKVNPTKLCAKAMHRLIHMLTCDGSLNHDYLAAKLSQGLAVRHILHRSVPAAMMDH